MGRIDCGADRPVSVLPLVQRYACLDLRTPSRLERTSSNGMSEMSLAV